MKHAISKGDHNNLSYGQWGALCLCLVLFVALRSSFIGHLLVWDEAMNLCTVRSFAAQGSDDFSNWFWTHPPMYCLAMRGLNPLQSGFAERVEILNIFITAINWLLLFQLNRRIFSNRTALWAGFFLAVMPASVFFDMWIKRDHLVPTFGIPAILMFLSGRSLLAAVFLGLALLAKETAAFYVIAVLVLWTLKADGKRNLRDLAVLTVIPTLLSGWWYLVVNAQSIIRNLNFAAEKTEHWQQSAVYYFQNLEREMGTTGWVLAIIGISALFYHLSKPRPPGTMAVKSQFTARACLWPVALLLPNYGLLSLLENKVAWIVIILLPAWATLQGYAVDKMLAYYQSVLMNWIRADVSSLRKTLKITIPATLCATLVLTVSGPLFSLDYKSFLKSTDRGQWRGASMSREAAEAMNRHLKPNDRVLITSFHYWKSLAPDHACAVFTYYFEQPVKVLMRPSATAFTELVEDIRKYEIDWALLSPPLGPMETKVFGGFIEELELSPIRLEGAFLFKTDTIRLTPD